jgi:hypothetical protein
MIDDGGRCANHSIERVKDMPTEHTTVLVVDPRRAREMLLSDITDAQRATLTFGQNPPGTVANGMAGPPQPDQGGIPPPGANGPNQSATRSSTKDSPPE